MGTGRIICDVRRLRCWICGQRLDELTCEDDRKVPVPSTGRAAGILTGCGHSTTAVHPQVPTADRRSRGPRCALKFTHDSDRFRRRGASPVLRWRCPRLILAAVFLLNFIWLSTTNWAQTSPQEPPETSLQNTTESLPQTSPQNPSEAPAFPSPPIPQKSAQNSISYELDHPVFWDRTNLLLFAGVGLARGLDYSSTGNLRRRGRQEILLNNDIVDNKPLFATIEVAGTAASIGVSYLFHRTGHHRLERWTSIVHIGVGTFGAIHNYGLQTFHHSTP